MRCECLSFKKIYVERDIYTNKLFNALNQRNASRLLRKKVSLESERPDSTSLFSPSIAIYRARLKPLKAAVHPNCGMAVEEMVVMSRVGMIGMNRPLLLWVTHFLTCVTYTKLKRH